MGFETPETTLVLVSMIFSEVRMFLKQMNDTNTLIFYNWLLENTHKYHTKYNKLNTINVNTQELLYEFGVEEIFFLIPQLMSTTLFSNRKQFC